MKALSKKRMNVRTMESTRRKDISTYAPSILLGRSLNDIERRYAPGRLYAAGLMQIPLPRPRVAIVGSREATPKSLADAEAITKTLIQENVEL